MTRVVFLVGSVIVSLVALVAAGWLVFSGGNPSATGGVCDPEQPELLEAEVIRSLPHDPDAFTQGLVFDDSGRLWESTGLRGESEVRQLDLDSGSVLSSASLPEEYFGEGLTTTEAGSLLQLTWTSGVALEWSVGSDEGSTPEPEGEFDYEGEGWGITTLDDGFHAMSDGTDTLQFRTPDDFSVASIMEVQRADGAADRLNELEWDGESLWANRYQSDEILRIDVNCGVVDAVVDASAVVSAADDAIDAAGLERDIEDRDVLNGIAWMGSDHPERFLITGKRWPVIYEVSFVAT